MLPSTGQYFAMVVLLLSTSTICTVLVITVHYRGSYRGDIPGPLRRIVFGCLSYMFCLQNQVQTVLRAIDATEEKVSDNYWWRVLRFESNFTKFGIWGSYWQNWALVRVMAWCQSDLVTQSVMHMSNTKPHLILSMGQCKKDVNPVRYHWSYIFLALTHRYFDVVRIIQ